MTIQRDTELLERVMQYIDDPPEQHDQSTWIDKGDCGTAACLAGWAGLLSGWKCAEFNFFTSPDGRRRLHVADLAGELLGLDYDEAQILFHGGNDVDLLRVLVKDIANGERLTDGWEYRATGVRRRGGDQR